MPASTKQQPTGEPRERIFAIRRRTATDHFSLFVYVLVVAALAGQVGFVIWITRT